MATSNQRELRWSEDRTPWFLLYRAHISFDVDDVYCGADFIMVRRRDADVTLTKEKENQLCVQGRQGDVKKSQRAAKGRPSGGQWEPTGGQGDAKESKGTPGGAKGGQGEAKGS